MKLSPFRRKEKGIIYKRCFTVDFEVSLTQHFALLKCMVNVVKFLTVRIEMRTVNPHCNISKNLESEQERINMNNLFRK